MQITLTPKQINDIAEINKAFAGDYDRITITQSYSPDSLKVVLASGDSEVVAEYQVGADGGYTGHLAKHAPEVATG